MSIHASSVRRSVGRALAVLLAVTAATAVFASPAFAHPVLTISASPTTVSAGSTVTLTISGTSNGNYSNARIEVSAGSGTGGTTGTLTSFTSSPTCGTGIPTTPTCSEITNKYRLSPVNLTNGQAFSYTITFTVDAGTTPGTFRGNAQFYKSDNTTDGLTTGPVITVVEPPRPDFTASKVSVTYDLLNRRLTLVPGVANTGTGPANGLTLDIVTSPGGLFATGFPGGCTGVPDAITCSAPGAVIPAGSPVIPTPTVLNVNLLALGNYTVTGTYSTAGETNLTDNSVVYTCTVLTGLLVSCV